MDANALFPGPTGRDKAQLARQKDETSNREQLEMRLCISFEIDMYEMKFQSQGGNQVRANQIGHSEPEGQEVVVVIDSVSLKDGTGSFSR